MKQYILILSAVLLFVGNTFSQNKALLDSAYSYYNNGKYDNAIEAYNRVINDGYESASVYYNIGNSFYKKGDITDAIINFERAKLLDPANEDISYNLRIANQQIVDKVEAVPEIIIVSWYNNILNKFSYDGWGVFSIILFVVSLLLLLAYFFGNKVSIKKGSFFFAVILMIFSIVFIFFAQKQYNNKYNHNKAIVYTLSVAAKSSPSETAKDIFILHEGTKVTVTDNLDEWVEIKLSDDKKGWVKTADIVVI